jgi:FAD/FMN-containing dehydrogenase
VEALSRRELMIAAGAAVLAHSRLGMVPAQSPSAALRELAREVRGPVLVRGAPGYAGVAHVYDERWDGRLPRAVLLAERVADVQAAVRWAARHGVAIRARSGGHSYAGWSTVAGGLVVDLRRLRGIGLERHGTRAVIGPGAQLGDVYGRLAARGVTVPAGSCPSVGMGGLALGGGMGLAGRALGLTLDRVTGVQVVLADGSVRDASATNHPDLFWACRGGGGGNFGIVTSFRLRTAPAARAAWFSVSWPWTQAGEALAAWQSLMGDAPHALTSVLSLSTGPRVGALGQYMGDAARLPALLRPLTRVAGARLSVGSAGYGTLQRRWAGCLDLSAKACHTRGTRPGGTLPRARFAAGSDYVGRPLSAAGRDAAIATIGRRRGGTAALLFDSYGGAINRVPADATAFVHRDALYSIQYLAYGPTAAGAAWVRGARAALARHVNGEAYQNYIDPDLAHWPRAYYGANLPRLQAIKARVDPERLLDFPQAI